MSWNEQGYLRESFKGDSTLLWEYAVPAFSWGPCLCVSQEHGRRHLALCVSSPLGREPGVGPADPSQREDAGECLLPLARVKPFPAELLTVCSQSEVGAGRMARSPLRGGDQPASCGYQALRFRAFAALFQWGSVVPGTFLTVYLRQKGQDSAGFGTMEEGLISREGRNLRLPLRFAPTLLPQPGDATCQATSWPP